MDLQQLGIMEEDHLMMKNVNLSFVDVVRLVRH